MMRNNNKTCLVCGSQNFKSIHNNTLLKCTNCFFITANLEIDKKTLADIYTKNYFHGEEYLNYLDDKEAIQANFKKRLKKITQYDKINIKGNILEIGCAYGFFGELVSKLPDTNYFGIDVVSEAINYGKEILNLDIICEDYLNYTEQRKFDHVFMWDVIEHLPNPEKFIEKISNEINKDGYLYITTGDIQSLMAKLQGKNWRMIHPPSHIHYFSRKTLEQLLNRHGFSPESISYPPIYRSIKQIYYSLFLLNKKPNKLAQFVYKLIPENCNIPLNTYDIMFVIAKK